MHEFSQEGYKKELLDEGEEMRKSLLKGGKQKMIFVALLAVLLLAQAMIVCAEENKKQDE